jgi:hypothetical protein
MNLKKEEICALAPVQSLFTFEDDKPRTSHVGNNETLFYQLGGELRDKSKSQLNDAASRRCIGHMQC